MALSLPIMFFLRNLVLLTLLTSIMDYAHVSLVTKLSDKLVKYLVLGATLVVGSFRGNNQKRPQLIVPVA